MDIASLHTKNEFSEGKCLCGDAKNIQEYNEILQGLATLEGVEYIDFNDVMIESALYDGVHMNASGKKFMVEKLVKTLLAAS